MKKIVSFGDSFIFGSEIPNNPDGSLAWPGVAARDLGYAFECRAIPGCGNTRILKQILEYFGSHQHRDTLAVINWTWTIRFDLMHAAENTDITVGPTCVPEKLQENLDPMSSGYALNFFQRFVDTSPTQYMGESLRSILVAQRYLAQHNISTVQTYMDHDMLNANQGGTLLEFYRRIKLPSWPEITDQTQWVRLQPTIQTEVLDRYEMMAVPPWIKVLQDCVREDLKDFDGMNFLEWSHHNSYPVTPEPRSHPLDQAHQSAALLWKDRYDRALAR